MSPATAGGAKTGPSRRPVLRAGTLKQLVGTAWALCRLGTRKAGGLLCPDRCSPHSLPAPGPVHPAHNGGPMRRYTYIYTCIYIYMRVYSALNYPLWELFPLTTSTEGQSSLAKSRQ